MDNLFRSLSLFVSEVIRCSEFTLLELLSFKTMAQEDVAGLSSLNLNHVVMVVLVFFFGLGNTKIPNLNNVFFTYQNVLLSFVFHRVGTHRVHHVELVLGFSDASVTHFLY